VPNPISDLPLYVAEALGIALVALTDTISTASSFAARTRQDIDGDWGMIGITAANVAAAFFQGFPVSTSGSCTAVAEQSGAKTRLTGIVGAALIVLAPGLLKNLPNPALAAVVIAAALSLADVPGTVRVVASASCRVPALDHRLPRRGSTRRAGGHRGCGCAIDPQRVPARVVAPPDHARPRPRDARPARPELHPDAEQLTGLVIFRFDAPLFFANARTFREQIRRLAAAEPRPQWILIAAEPITDVDTTAADMLTDLDEELNANGTSLVFAELKYPDRAKPERYQLIGPLDPKHFFPTIEAALATFGQQTGANWTPPAQTSATPR
jgi:MFS superfamily sulfate permease-like transporter